MDPPGVWSVLVDDKDACSGDWSFGVRCRQFQCDMCGCFQGYFSRSISRERE